MCQTAFYAHPLCGCRWLAVTQPCGPGLGFSTCPSFFTGRAKAAPRAFGAPKSQRSNRLCKNGAASGINRVDPATAFLWAGVPCPVHTFGGCYDRNSVRMIWGTGPSKDDCGIECKCSVM